MTSYKEIEPGKYKIYVELGYDERGKRIRKTKTVEAKTEAALKRQIRAFELHWMNKKVTDENMTFADLTEKWFELHVNQKLSLRTYQTYYSTMNNYILPYFKNMKLNKIKPLHIEEFFAHEKKEGRKNLKGKYLILKSIFTKSIKWKLIELDPMEGIEEPEVEKRKREKDYYNEEELKRLFNALNNAFPKHRIAIKMAAILGLRKSEILGIRHQSLDFDNNTILIDAQLHYDKDNKKFLLGPPKNKKPRIVVVPDAFMEEIKEYADNHLKLKEECGSAWEPMKDDNGQPIDLLYTNPYGYPNHINSISNEWSKILNRYDLPYLNFHGLRHSFASYMVSRKADYKTIQEQLGHSNISLTINTYSHLSLEDKKREVSVFDDILKT